MNEEIELKLTLAPADAARLKRQALLRTLRNGPVSAKRLVSVYFDTPGCDLQRNKLVLRVRHVGKKRIQTLKQAPLPGQSTLVRGEWEAPVALDRPDLHSIGDPKLRALVAPHFTKGKLREVFLTDIRRTVWPLKVGRAEIACMLDVGKIRANGRSRTVSEVELELESGPRAELFRLARRLNQEVPLRVARATKAERGYLLAAGRSSEGEAKATAVHLGTDMTVAAAFLEIARGAVDHILANVDGANLGKNPEGVHQLRVGIRRLRNAISLFKPIVQERGALSLGRDLRWLQRQLGPAREWDTLINETLAPAASELGRGSGFRALRRAAEQRRLAGYQQTRAALRDRRYTDLLLRVEAWLDALSSHAVAAQPKVGDSRKPSLTAFSAETLRARAKRAEKLGRKMRKIDDAELHKLRIRVKKLRYASEFFRDLWPGKPARRYIGVLKSLQDRLGFAHDALIAVDLIAVIAADAGPNAETASESLLAWNAARLKSERKTLIRLWNRFAATAPFWTAD